MALIIRRHWLSMVLSVAIVVGLTGLFWIERAVPVLGQAPGNFLGSEVEPAGASSPDEKGTDPLVYSQVQAIRQELCLTSQDLAATGCNQKAAEQVLSALLAWYETNQQALDQSEQRQREAQAALQETWRQINIGPRNDAVLVRLPQEEAGLERARRQSRALVESALTAAESGLTSGQKQLLQTARSNAGAPSRYRYAAGLTQTQVQELLKGNRRQMGDPRALAKAEQESLLGTQKNALASAQTNQALHIEGVLAAEAKVLPPPAEGREQNAVRDNTVNE